MDFFFFNRFKYKNWSASDVLVPCSRIRKPGNVSSVAAGRTASSALWRGWTWDLESHVLLKALQTHITGRLYFPALSTSSPKQFAKSEFTVFVLRTVIFLNENITFCLKKSILKESSKSGLIKMPFRNIPLLMEVLSLCYVLKQFTPITSGHILGNKDCLTCISRRFYFW